MNSTRHGTGCGIGVNIIGLAVLTKAYGRYNRNKARTGQGVDHTRVNLDRFPYKPQIQHAFDLAIHIPHGTAHLARGDHLAVLARNPDSKSPGLADKLRHLLVDRTGQNHFDHIHHVGVCNPQPVNEVRGNVQPLEHLVDLRTTPMHHNRVNTHLFEQGNVPPEGLGQTNIPHGMATILDHNGVPRVAPQVWQGVSQNGGLMHCIMLGAGRRESRFSHALKILPSSVRFFLIRSGQILPVPPAMPQCPARSGCW